MKNPQNIEMVKRLTEERNKYLASIADNAKAVALLGAQTEQLKGAVQQIDMTMKMVESLDAQFGVEVKTEVPDPTPEA